MRSILLILDGLGDRGQDCFILNEDAVKRFLDEFALNKAGEVIKGYLETIWQNKSENP